MQIQSLAIPGSFVSSEETQCNNEFPKDEFALIQEALQEKDISYITPISYIATISSSILTICQPLQHLLPSTISEIYRQPSS